MDSARIDELARECAAAAYPGTKKALEPYLRRMHEQYQERRRDNLQPAIAQALRTVAREVLERAARLNIPRDGTYGRGCSSHACRIKKPTGMGTNSGKCYCEPHEYARAVSKWLRTEAAKYEEQSDGD